MEHFKLFSRPIDSGLARTLGPANHTAARRTFDEGAVTRSTPKGPQASGRAGTTCKSISLEQDKCSNHQKQKAFLQKRQLGARQEVSDLQGEEEDKPGKLLQIQKMREHPPHPEPNQREEEEGNTQTPNLQPTHALNQTLTPHRQTGKKHTHTNPSCPRTQTTHAHTPIKHTRQRTNNYTHTSTQRAHTDASRQKHRGHAWSRH